MIEIRFLVAFDKFRCEFFNKTMFQYSRVRKRMALLYSTKFSIFIHAGVVKFPNIINTLTSFIMVLDNMSIK
jgi:hypothetical protein